MVPFDVIQKQMARRCPAKAKWKWEAIPNGDNEFLISFPSFHDLDVVDGIQVAVPGFISQMSVTAWKPTIIPHKFELEQVWLHVEGVPHNVHHFWGLWAIGSLMGKTLDVDLISLRRRGVVRVLVGMLDTTKFAKKLDKDGACVKSDVVLKLKGLSTGAPVCSVRGRHFSVWRIAASLRSYELSDLWRVVNTDQLKMASLGAAGSTTWRAPAPVRQLFWRVRSSWKNTVMRRPRCSAPMFSYDLQSYDLNFDDDLS
ncbi:uncharacterized protein LOC124647454 [Lolium rigidum]|uniref:uncharacterized protein LOC124647454 n=1 Tax=Lolium rigidum TaxID=89674 RepID=UPI001F5D5897|nr:uncharacterized protein LOC124647454 [Lolium rigidum]